MNEFDIYLESTGSMEVYPGNRMAVFRNLFPEPLQLDGDWRVALAELFSLLALRMSPPRAT